jgi:hypothetical protein
MDFPETFTTSCLFSFNGQEKTNEISGEGNHNTAMFWEYDTRIGRRWNVDPIIKPWQSGYLTFSNSPILKIDPNGDDDYTVNQKGEISLSKKTEDKNDNLIALGKNGKIEYDDDGKLLNKSHQLDKGILNNINEGETKRGEKYNYFNVKGDDKATGTFEFLATNTNVEWSQNKFGTDKNIISTSKDEGKEPGGGAIMHSLLKNGYSVRENIHSHPFRTNSKLFGPSGYLDGDQNSGDKDFASWLNRNYPNSKSILKVFDATDLKYYQYDHNRMIKKN